MKNVTRGHLAGSRKSDGDITVRLISRFKALISDGTFVPGAKLPPERELARQFKVNRASLRQALKVMQLMGVAWQRVGDGTYLSRDAANILREPIEFMIVLADISDEELLEARLIVESELAARAAERATGEDLAAMRRAMKAMEKSTGEQVRVDADLAFHEAIFRASGNRVCGLIFSVIHRALTLSMGKIAGRAYVGRPLAFHKAIYSAISSRKPDEARREMINHLMDTRTQLLSANTNHADGERARRTSPENEDSRENKSQRNPSLLPVASSSTTR
jgi:GntR family transcriptional repressor for pyruvate dehydrogenase complex